MRGVLLGSGGWIPTARRETCCFLVRDGAQALLIDAGTGIGRLVERPGLLDGVEELRIVLTHFHLDHVAGLSYLPALPLARPPAVWGPGEALAGVPTEALLRRLLDPPLFAVPLEELVSGVRELPRGELQLDSFRLRTRTQPRHSHPTLAVRVGDDFTYCTDTAADPANVAFAAGSAVLLHEAWRPGPDPADETHSSASEAARIARDAGVGELVLIHVSPLLRSEGELLAAAAPVFASTLVGEDGLELRGD